MRKLTDSLASLLSSGARRGCFEASLPSPSLERTRGLKEES